jgi:hypothetical protein
LIEAEDDGNGRHAILPVEGVTIRVEQLIEAAVRSYVESLA